jgi:hypothetical protein
LSYYVPEGYGAVFTCTPSKGFFKKRVPQQSYFGGDVMITANSETDGSYTPFGADFIAEYYDEGMPKYPEDHWSVLFSEPSFIGFHKMSVAYRARNDMTIWADGMLSNGRTGRIETEWNECAGEPEADLVLGGYSFKPGDRFTATFVLNEPIERFFRVGAALVFPNGRMLNLATREFKPGFIATRVPRLRVPFSLPLLSGRVPAFMPDGIYELVVLFFDHGFPVRSRDDAFLQVSSRFKIVNNNEFLPE